MSFVWAGLLLAVVAVGWLMNWVSLPGNWLIVLGTAVYAWWVPVSQRTGIGWIMVVVLFLLAGLGELLEFTAGAAGVAKVGGSRRSAVLAIFGSLGGGFVGAWLGVPIPIVGTLAGILLGAALGALAGGAVGEFSKGRDLEQCWRVGHAAFWGRLLGTFGKLTVGAVMAALVAAALVLK
jgi:uncharacterized protein YqgC (DUF456 family)